MNLKDKIKKASTGELMDALRTYADQVLTRMEKDPDDELVERVETFWNAAYDIEDRIRELYEESDPEEATRDLQVMINHRAQQMFSIN